MSGSIQADRIERGAVRQTVDDYIDQVLKNFTGYKSTKITGSYNAGTKKDHGDVDLSIWIEGNGRDLKQVKKEFKEYLEGLPDTVTVPFKAGKNKGRKAQMYGTIVTCQFPISGFEGLAVQIDNNISLSEEEQEYQKNFLDLSAAQQGLISGLVRVIMQEQEPRSVLKRMGITKKIELEPGQELEFVLSSNRLSLRKVRYENFKETEREEIWKSSKWQDVVTLLKGFDLSQSYEDLLKQVSEKIQKVSSKRRILGIMKSLINVGEAEKGTEKGDEKERAIRTATTNLGVIQESSDDAETKTVALYAGGFKPPHKAHFANAEKLLEKADKLIVFIGSKVREGVPITAEQSEKVWKIYKEYLNKPVEIRVSAKSPVTDIYDLVGKEDLKDTNFIIGKSQGADEDKKWKWIHTHENDFPNVKFKLLPVITDNLDEKLSASSLRKSIENLKKADWIPSCVDRDDIVKILDILLKPLELQAIQEEMMRNVGNILEGMSGIPLAMSSVVTSESREKLGKFFEFLQQNYGDKFQFIFNNASISILDKEEGDNRDFDYEDYAQKASLYENEEPETKEEFDYTSNIASLIEFMEENGWKVQPLPEILLNKEKQTGGLLDRKTGEYSPEGDGLIRIYTDGRQPRDILRSFVHEAYHHHQNLSGELTKLRSDTVKDDKTAEQIEGDAYLQGNLLFRKWLEKEGHYSS